MISIVGAGPIGCYVAYLFAKANHDVAVFEEHAEVGKPVQCTGLVTSEIKNCLKLKGNVIVNKLKKVVTVSPSGKKLTIKFKNPNYLLNREKFDKYLCSLAQDNGVKLYLKHKFLDFKNPYLILNNKKHFKTDILIGADGPLSRVAKACNLFGKRKFVIGFQARAKLQDIEKETIEFYLHEGYFAWIVPENESFARVGVVSESDVKKRFEIFLKNLNRKYRIKNFQTGLIPIYNPKLKLQASNVYIVGDAATLVKPTTYGGIIPGLKAANLLFKAITENLNYEKLVRKEIGKELFYGLLIRKMLNKLSASDLDNLVEICNEKQIKKILAETDREFPSKILMQLLKKPTFLKFAKAIVKPGS